MSSEHAIASDDAASMPAPMRAWRGLEMTCLLALPPLVWAVDLWRPHVLAALAVMALYALVVLLNDPTFDRRSLWRGSALRSEIVPLLVIFGLGVVLFAGLMYAFERERLFVMVRQRPQLWLTIMIGYPIVSVYPQELVWRAFFFHRYACLFRGRWGLIIGSGVMFAWAHVLFQHWIPIVSTLVGGLIFAWRYDRTRSLAVVWVEHTLYGCLIFTIGLGMYFFHGTITAVRQVSP
jgi:uncharacterized protein